MLKPFEWKDRPSLMEHLFPVQKISAESFKEQMAGAGKTLTALGSYWKGRKPLILNKACILGALLPATNNRLKDLEIFELLMGMDSQTMQRRLESNMPASKHYTIGEYLILPYNEQVKAAKRPEELDESLFDHIWEKVNNHLGTDASSFPEMVEQMGTARFGHRPKVADVFCGSGQIPFEAARLGCDVYASEPLFVNVSFHLSCGWTGVVGANGTGKTTLLQLASGRLLPVKGHIGFPEITWYCAQRTDEIPQYFDAFLAAPSSHAHAIRSRLNIQEEWIHRWPTLSHGERKRAQIGVALWKGPDLLAVDEPTNHLDEDAREMIYHAFSFYRGIGLIVSHDRTLLDNLCQQCLFIEPPCALCRPGGYSQGKIEAEREHHTRKKQHDIRKRNLKRLQKEMARRRELARSAHKRRSKRGLDRKDHDAKEKKDRARVTGKDAVGGKLLRQVDGRVHQARESLEMIRMKKEPSLGIWIPGSQSKKDHLLNIMGGEISLGPEKRLIHPQLTIKPSDRIALTGPNGTGKSTLIRYLLSELNCPEEQLTYIPQEIDRHKSHDILKKALSMPKDQLGYLMTTVSQLGSNPERLLSSEMPSPGETRKLLLGIGITHSPHIIIMDEPTNHLDLPSIECLEAALARCPCSLLLVSHDRIFLENLTDIRWEIKKDNENEKECRLIC